MQLSKRVSFSGTYFFYFAILGVTSPYLSLLLDFRGFSSVEIGQLLAAITLMRIVGPNVWAQAADKSGRYLSTIRLGSVLALLAFLFVFPAEGFWFLTASIALFSLFWSAILPQLEVVTLDAVHAKQSRTSYGSIRSWGSVGFIGAVMLGGILIDFSSPEVILPFIFALLLGLAVTSFALRDDAREPSQAESAAIWDKLLDRRLLLFFFAMLLLQCSFAPFYGFFSLYCRDLGYSTRTTGLLISAGVLAEIVIYVFASRLISRWGLYMVTLVSLLATALRWWATGNFGDWLLLLFAMQSLHAVSFALTQAATVQFIRGHFSATQQSRGQAVFIGIVYSGGAAIGALVTGYVWEDGLGAQLAYNMAAIAAVIAAGLIAILIRIDNRFNLKRIVSDPV